MGGIYEVELRWAKVQCIYTKFREDWFSHSKVDGAGVYTDNMEIA
jgi:hypothetical protein